LIDRFENVEARRPGFCPVCAALKDGATNASFNTEHAEKLSELSVEAVLSTGFTKET
jgi:hypothetical protein